jgi:hypothetical protein
MRTLILHHDRRLLIDLLFRTQKRQYAPSLPRSKSESPKVSRLDLIEVESSCSSSGQVLRSNPRLPKVHHVKSIEKGHPLSSPSKLSFQPQNIPERRSVKAASSLNGSLFSAVTTPPTPQTPKPSWFRRSPYRESSPFLSRSSVRRPQLSAQVASRVSKSKSKPALPILDGPLHDQALIVREYKPSLPIKPTHESTPKSSLANFAMLADQKLPTYNITMGMIIDSDKGSESAHRVYR